MLRNRLCYDSVTGQTAHCPQPGCFGRRSITGIPCEPPLQILIVPVDHMGRTAQSILQCCSDPCSLILHDGLEIIQFYPCWSAEVLVVPDPVLLYLCCSCHSQQAKVFTNNGMYLKTSTLASCCKAYCIQDHHADKYGNCWHCPCIHHGALCPSLESGGSAIIALCGPIRYTCALATLQTEPIVPAFPCISHGIISHCFYCCL